MSPEAKEIQDVKARAELSAIWKRIDEQTKLTDAISCLTTQVSVMNVTVQNSVEVQKELKSELSLHREKFDYFEKLKYEFVQKVNENIDKREEAFDVRIRELEMSPGNRLMNDKDFVKRQIITVVVTAIAVFICSLVASLIVDYNIRTSEVKSLREFKEQMIIDNRKEIEFLKAQI